MKTTDEVLLQRGYREFAPSKIDNPGIKTCFQKRFDDDAGKKYFITVYKWSAVRHPYTGVEFPESYEYDVQLYVGEERSALDLKFHCDWEIDAVEAYMETIWGLNVFEYYERFDE